MFFTGVTDERSELIFAGAVIYIVGFINERACCRHTEERLLQKAQESGTKKPGEPQ